MHNGIVFLIAVCLMAAGFSAAGADLTLKNGKVYRNYRIKSVLDDSATIAYMAQDGSPDIAVISLKDLPDNIVAALGVNVSSAGGLNSGVAGSVSTPEELAAQLSAQLKTEFAALPVDETSPRHFLINKSTELLKKKLAVFFSDAEFETVWVNSDGITAKVLKINRSPVLKVGEKVFIKSSTQLGNRFRAQIYATGCMMDSGGELLKVFTFDETSAVKFGMESILTTVGFKDDKTRTAVQSSSSADQTTVLAAPATPVQPVVNNYYIYDDDDKGEPIYVIRDGRRYNPPYLPPVRPPRPGNRPGVPAVRPENNRPSPKDKLSKNKSTVQRDDKKIQSYEHLPDWAQPRYSRP